MKKSKNKILITGVNGFIGSNVASYLTGKFTLIGLDTDSVCSDDNLDLYVQMLLPSPDLDDILRQIDPDFCIHCAGSASVGLSVTNPSEDFGSGPPVLFQLVDSIRKTGSGCKIIFLSSAAVYGDPKELPVTEKSELLPISPYGYHKMMCEKVLEEFGSVYGLKFAILRIFSCYGRGLRKQLLWDVCNKFAENKASFFGTGDESRDFIHVKDVARAIEIMIEQDASGIFNAGTGKDFTVAEVIELISEKVCYPMDRISFDGRAQQGYPVKWCADISRLKGLGFSPSITFNQGIDDYVRWFENAVVQCR